MKEGVKMTTVAFYDKIGVDEQLRIPTSVLVATSPPGGRRVEAELPEVTEEDREAYRKEQAEKLKEERKKATSKIAKQGSGKRTKSKSGDGRDVEIGTDGGKLVISSERKHKSKKKHLQDRRTEKEKETAAAGKGSKYRLHKDRNQMSKGLDVNKKDRRVTPHLSSIS